jgi:1,4-alpha-glucan branching enzyme
VPRLVIGWFQPGNPPALSNEQRFDLAELPGQPGLWGVAAELCGLVEGNVYHYWFEVTDSSPYRNGWRILVTDPLARTVDWRLRAGALGGMYNGDDRDPAAVVKYLGGELVPCDPAGETFVPAPLLPTAQAPTNNRLVIYELPTSWTQSNPDGGPGVGVGTFRDVAALVDVHAAGANFTGIAALAPGRSHLQELGINALELLPPADSFVNREWGYATSNYLAPDFDLGLPEGNSSPTANVDLAILVSLCHAQGIRFFADVVMAFGTHAPLENVNFPDFHLDPEASPDDPDANQSGGQGRRNGFGGTLWRYAHPADGYDPLDGGTRTHFPARQYMKLALLRWMEDFALDGLRLDSVNNIANWDFVQEFKDLARQHWAESGSAPDRFLVVGEELGVPKELVTQGRLDGLWNEDFKRMVRSVILGQNGEKEPSFEGTVRKLIDCRLMGFTDGAQAVNYLGSHDVEGFRNERLYNFLVNNGVPLTEERIKLAFVCLLTAVGVPMIFAGDEFADQHDLGVGNPAKQRDAVNFERVDEPWRRSVFDYVSRLVKFRTSSAALSVNDTDFIHVDFDEGKRVVVWRRGFAGSDEQVVVVANFSGYVSDQAGHGGEYYVPNWPATPAGKRWREITQERDVPDEWVGREAIFPWEAKVYALV